MSARFQTTGPGRCILQPASGQLSDHVTRALNEARSGRPAWIKARAGNPDDRLWSIEFLPNTVEPDRPRIIPIAWHYATTFNDPSIPSWIRQARTILDRLCSPTSPGGTR